MSDLTMAVYAILNTVSEDAHDLYVGSSINVDRRWAVHRSSLRCGNHLNVRLQRAHDKYGADAFEYVILERVATVKALPEREQAWMDTLQPTYNLRPTAEDNRGWVPSETTLLRRSTGMKRAWADPRKRQNLLHFTEAGSAALLGKPLSPERRMQVSAATRAAFTANPELGQRISRALSGRKKSDAHVAQMGASSAAHWETEAYRETFRKARKEDRSYPGDRHRPPEVRAKISAGKMGKKRSDVAAKNADPAYQERCRIGREAYWARKAAERQAAGLRTKSKYGIANGEDQSA